MAAFGRPFPDVVPQPVQALFALLSTAQNDGQQVYRAVPIMDYTQLLLQKYTPLLDSSSIINMANNVGFKGTAEGVAEMMARYLSNTLTQEDVNLLTAQINKQVHLTNLLDTNVQRLLLSLQAQQASAAAGVAAGAVAGLGAGMPAAAPVVPSAAGQGSKGGRGGGRGSGRGGGRGGGSRGGRGGRGRGSGRGKAAAAAELGESTEEEEAEIRSVDDLPPLPSSRSTKKQQQMAAAAAAAASAAAASGPPAAERVLREMQQTGNKPACKPRGINAQPRDGDAGKVTISAGTCPKCKVARKTANEPTCQKCGVSSADAKEELAAAKKIKKGMWRQSNRAAVWLADKALEAHLRSDGKTHVFVAMYRQGFKREALVTKAYGSVGLALEQNEVIMKYLRASVAVEDKRLQAAEKQAQQQQQQQQQRVQDEPLGAADREQLGRLCEEVGLACHVAALAAEKATVKDLAAMQQEHIGLVQQATGIRLMELLRIINAAKVAAAAPAAAAAAGAAAAAAAAVGGV